MNDKKCCQEYNEHLQQEVIQNNKSLRERDVTNHTSFTNCLTNMPPGLLPQLKIILILCD